MLIASPDLVALARSQITLLTQSLGAGSSVMYLAEELAAGLPLNLVEVAAFPEDAPSRLNQDFSLALPASDRQAITKSSRLVIPLLYEQQILGFLMTGREDREWTELEQLQIQQVANTLAIACGIERRCQWLEMSYHTQQMQQQSFIASLLHQLRNPLTAIRTFSQLIRRRLLSDDPNQSFVTGILRETIHLQELLQTAEPTENFTPLLKPSQSPLLLTGAMELSPIDLENLLEPLISTTSAIAADRNLQFHSQIPNQLPPILANRHALREVIANLLDNALKYTPAPGQIKLIVQIQPEILAIQVTDTGYGIPPQDLNNLFQRHFRGRQAEGTITGTGLGLAIAKDLVEKMQGEILVTSKVNQGTTFTLELKIFDPEKC
jgi:signal transduction histidine kinase